MSELSTKMRYVLAPATAAALLALTACGGEKSPADTTDDDSDYHYADKVDSQDSVTPTDPQGKLRAEKAIRAIELLQGNGCQKLFFAYKAGKAELMHSDRDITPLEGDVVGMNLDNKTRLEAEYKREHGTFIQGYCGRVTIYSMTTAGALKKYQNGYNNYYQASAVTVSRMEQEELPYETDESGGIRSFFPFSVQSGDNKKFGADGLELELQPYGQVQYPEDALNAADFKIVRQATNTAEQLLR